VTIQAVIFDFGGVFTPSPFTGMQRWFAGRGIDPAQGALALFGTYDEDTNHPWHRLERGEVPLEAALQEIQVAASDAGLRMDLAALFAPTSWPSTIREDVVERVRRLRGAGYRTALLTNNIAEFSTAWREMIPVDDLFDIVIDSSKVGLRKPDPRIFGLALHELGVAAERSVFLDDAPGNVAAACRLGMRGILVEDDHTGAMEALDRLLDATDEKG
jgi:epoxide hydrolase-like predicted phosphatase